MSAPAGWHRDPSDPSRERWWDGVGWTAHQRPAEAVAQAPRPQFGELAPVRGQSSSYAPQSVAYAPMTPVEGEPTVDVDTNTVWIWLAIVASALPFAFLLLFDWNAYIEASIRAELNSDPSAMQGMFGQIAILAIFGWGTFAAFVVFCWLDCRELRNRGVRAPFHWAWSFFSYLNGGVAVYMIGRAVVLKRRTVSGGWPPLWVWIAVMAIGIVVTVVWFVSLISMIMSGVGQFS